MRHCHSLQVLIQCQVCLHTFSETTRLKLHQCASNAAATSSQEEEDEDEEEDEEEDDDDEEGDVHQRRRKRHNAIEVTKISEKCHVCTVALPTLYEMNLHRWCTPGGKVYRCLTCSLLIGGLEDVPEHCRSHSRRRSLRHKAPPNTKTKRRRRRRYRCDFCPETFLGLSLIMEHRLSVHQADVCNLKCNSCDTSFPDADFLADHLAQRKCQLLQAETTDAAASTCTEDDDDMQTPCKDSPETYEDVEVASPAISGGGNNMQLLDAKSPNVEKDKSGPDSQLSEGMYQCEACRFTFNLGQCHVTESAQVICSSCGCILETVASELGADRLEFGADKSSAKDSFRPVEDSLADERDEVEEMEEQEGEGDVRQYRAATAATSKQYQHCTPVEISDAESENEDVTVLRCEGLDRPNTKRSSSGDKQKKRDDVSEEEEEEGEDDDCAVVKVTIPSTNMKRNNGSHTTESSTVINIDVLSDEEATTESSQEKEPTETRQDNDLTDTSQGKDPMKIKEKSDVNQTKDSAGSSQAKETLRAKKGRGLAGIKKRRGPGVIKKTREPIKAKRPGKKAGLVGFKTKQKLAGVTKSSVKKVRSMKLAKKLGKLGKMPKKEDGRCRSKEKKTYQCDVCQLTFGSVTWIVRHRKKHTQVSLTCTNCKHLFSRSCELGHHLSMCFSGNPAPVPEPAPTTPPVTVPNTTPVPEGVKDNKVSMKKVSKQQQQQQDSFMKKVSKQQQQQQEEYSGMKKVLKQDSGMKKVSKQQQQQQDNVMKKVSKQQDSGMKKVSKQQQQDSGIKKISKQQQQQDNSMKKVSKQQDSDMEKVSKQDSGIEKESKQHEEDSGMKKVLKQQDNSGMKKVSKQDSGKKKVSKKQDSSTKKVSKKQQDNGMKKVSKQQQQLQDNAMEKVSKQQQQLQDNDSGMEKVSKQQDNSMKKVLKQQQQDSGMKKVSKKQGGSGMEKVSKLQQKQQDSGIEKVSKQQQGDNGMKKVSKQQQQQDSNMKKISKQQQQDSGIKKVSKQDSGMEKVSKQQQQDDIVMKKVSKQDSGMKKVLKKQSSAMEKVSKQQDNVMNKVSGQQQDNCMKKVSKLQHQQQQDNGMKKSQAKIFTCDFCFLSFASVSWVMRHRREHSRNISSYECQVCRKVSDKSSEFGRHLAVCPTLKAKEMQTSKVILSDAGMAKKQTSTKKLSSEESAGTGYERESSEADRNISGTEQETDNRDSVSIAMENELSEADENAAKMPNKRERNFKCDYCWQLFASARWVIRHRKIHTSDTVCQFCREYFEKYVELGKHLGTGCSSVSSKTPGTGGVDVTCASNESDTAPDNGVTVVCDIEHTLDDTTTAMCDSGTTIDKDDGGSCGNSIEDMAIECESDNVLDDVIVCDNNDDNNSGDNNNNIDDNENMSDIETLCHSIDSVAHSIESSATAGTDVCSMTTSASGTTTTSSATATTTSTTAVEEAPPSENKQVWDSNFCCDFCPQSFANARWVIRHRKQHLTQENLVCQRCGDQFPRSAELGKHLAVFFCCDFCGQTYASARWVMRHRRTHSNGDSHSCQNCHQVFARSVEISKHLGQCHLPAGNSLCTTTEATTSSSSMKHLQTQEVGDLVPADPELSDLAPANTSTGLPANTCITAAGAAAEHWVEPESVALELNGSSPLHETPTPSPPPPSPNLEVPLPDCSHYVNPQQTPPAATLEPSTDTVPLTNNRVWNGTKVFHIYDHDTCCEGNDETSVEPEDTTLSLAPLDFSHTAYSSSLPIILTQEPLFPSPTTCLPPSPHHSRRWLPPPPLLHTPPPPLLHSASAPTATTTPTPCHRPLQSPLTARALQCDFCPETFQLGSQLLQHRQTHPDSHLPYQCPDCVLVLDGQYDLDNHLLCCPQKHSQPFDYSVSGNSGQDLRCQSNKEEEEEDGRNNEAGKLPESSSKGTIDLVESRDFWSVDKSPPVVAIEDDDEDDEECNSTSLGEAAALTPSQGILSALIPRDCYKCDYCPEALPNASALLQHRCKHTLSTTCHRCSKYFLDLNQLARHFTYSCSPLKKPGSTAPFETKQYRCDFCHKEYGGSNWIMRHRRYHTSEKNYLCRICGYLASSPGTMAKHLSHCPWVNCKNDTNVKTLSTPREILPKPTPLKEEYKPLPDAVFYCNYCHEGFPTENEMLQHQYTHMEVNSPTSPQQQELNFSMVPLNLSLKKPSSSVSANEIDKVEPKERVELVSEPSCTSKPNDLPHQNSNSAVSVVHEPSKIHQASSVMKQWDPKTFHCDFCGQAFASNNWVMRHRRLHCKESQYTCRNCGNTFDVSHKMAIHLTVCKHSSTKPKSDLPNNSETKEFSSSQENSSESVVNQSLKESGFLISNNQISNSAASESSQENKIVYTCDFCGKDFGSNNWIIRHRKMHVQETLFECRVCGETFQHSHEIALHLKNCRRPTKKDYKIARRALLNSEALAASYRRQASGQSDNKRRFLKSFPLCDFCGLCFPGRQLTMMEDGRKKCRLCTQQIHHPWTIKQHYKADSLNSHSVTPNSSDSHSNPYHSATPHTSDSHNKSCLPVPPNTSDSPSNSCHSATPHCNEPNQHLKLLNISDNVATKDKIPHLPSLNQEHATDRLGSDRDQSPSSSSLLSLEHISFKRKSSFDCSNYLAESNEEYIQPHKRSRLSEEESHRNQQNFNDKTKYYKSNLSFRETNLVSLLPKSSMEYSQPGCSSHDSAMSGNVSQSKDPYCGPSQRELELKREELYPVREEIIVNCDYVASQNAEKGGNDAHSSDDSEYGSSLEKFAESLNLICKKSKFRCDFCEESFGVAGNLLKHRLTHNSSNNNNSLWCRNCRRALATSQDLAQHLSWCRVNTKDGASDASSRRHNPDKMYKCDFCSQRFGHSLRLMKHRKDHVQEEGIFRCRRCDNVFYRSGVFADHLASCCLSRRTGHDSPRTNGKIIDSPPVINGTAHSSRRFVITDRQKLPRLFHCDICQKTFAGSNWIMRHRRGHTKEMPYKCRLCGASFIQPGCMADHLLTCYTNSCGVSAAAGKDYSNQNKTPGNSTWKPGSPNKKLMKGLFRCDFCGQRFPTIKEGLIHRQSHNGSFTGIFQCRGCGKLCDSANNLGLHLTQCFPGTDKPNLFLHGTVSASRSPKPKVPGGGGGGGALQQRQQQQQQQQQPQPQQQRVVGDGGKQCAVYACDICGKPFLGVAALVEHRKRHAKEIDIRKCYNCRENLRCPMSEHLLVCSAMRRHNNNRNITTTATTTTYNNNIKHSRRKSPVKPNQMKKFVEKHPHPHHHPHQRNQQQQQQQHHPSAGSSSSSSSGGSGRMAPVFAESPDRNKSSTEEEFSGTDDAFNTNFAFECCNETYKSLDAFTNHMKFHSRGPR
ncbi:hypothetical protein Ahia01_000677100 [Argonauta hians]